MADRDIWGCFIGNNQKRDAIADTGSVADPADIALPDRRVQLANDHRDGLHQQEALRKQYFYKNPVIKMRNTAMSLEMLDEVESFLESRTGRFAFVYNTDLSVKSSCFDHNSYKLRHTCGSGASGDVEAYIDTESNIKFVRKRLKEDKTFRKEELQSLLKLNHRGVVKAYAVLCCDAKVDLLLQDAGYPLGKCLERFCSGNITADRYWMVMKDFTLQAFEAVIYAHNNGIYHLDLKPENLLVHQNEHGEPVLVVADWGSSLCMEKRMNFHMDLTSEYMPPELWMQFASSFMARKMFGSSFLDMTFAPQPGFDAFALGLCVYFMGTMKHFMLDVSKKFADIISSQRIQQVSHQFDCNRGFAVKMILVLDHGDRLPEFGTSGDWIFPATIPQVLLDVIRATTNQDPDKRGTVQQMASLLRGAGQSEVAFKDPVPICDRRSAEFPQTEVARDHSLQVPGERRANKQLAEASRKPAPCVAKLDRADCFSKKMALFMKTWDNDVSGRQEQQSLHDLNLARSAQTISQTGEEAKHGLEPLVSCEGHCAATDVMKVGASGEEKQIVSVQELSNNLGEPEFGFAENLDSLRPTQKVAMDLDLKLLSFEDQVESPSQCEAFTSGKVEEGCKGEKDMSYLNETGENVLVDRTEFDLPQKQKLASASVSKGKKHSVKGKASKSSPKTEVSRGVASKGIGGHVRKSNSHGKQTVPFSRASVALLSSQVKQQAKQIPFVVASSSRPKPSARTMLFVRPPEIDPVPEFPQGQHVETVEQLNESAATGIAPAIVPKVASVSPWPEKIAECDGSLVLGAQSAYRQFQPLRPGPVSEVVPHVQGAGLEQAMDLGGYVPSNQVAVQTIGPENIDHSQSQVSVERRGEENKLVFSSAMVANILDLLEKSNGDVFGPGGQLSLQGENRQPELFRGTAVDQNSGGVFGPGGQLPLQGENRQPELFRGTAVDQNSGGVFGPGGQLSLQGENRQPELFRGTAVDQNGGDVFGQGGQLSLQGENRQPELFRGTAVDQNSGGVFGPGGQLSLQGENSQPEMFAAAAEVMEYSDALVPGNLPNFSAIFDE